MASKEIGITVLQPKGTKFCRNPVTLEEDLTLDENTVWLTS